MQTPLKKKVSRTRRTRRKLAAFGEFIRSAREQLAPSQLKATTLLAKAGLKVSQSWAAQLETGRITDPDVPMLTKIAQAYAIGYDRLIYELVRDKYALDDPAQAGPLSRERWRSVDGLLQNFPTVGRVAGLEADQLRAKAEMLKSELLDLHGIAQWQVEFTDLKELWVVSPHFQDDRNADLRGAVVHNLNRGVRYSYFVPKTDLDDGRPFWLFLQRLAQDHPALRSRLQKQIRSVTLEETDLRWIVTDLFLANPTDPATRTGFIGLRRDRAFNFAYRMTDFDAEAVAKEILPFLTKAIRPRR